MTDFAVARIVTLALVALAFSHQAASSQEPTGTGTCAAGLSPPVLAKWTIMGAAAGLGCPTAAEASAPVSPQGSAAREVTFPAATILWHASGPRAGQTFAITGCIYRLYFQYGGPAGWLGLPTSDAINTPDGKRQSFEGGVVTYQRAGQICEAEPAPVTSDTPPSSPTAPLDQFHDATHGDYLAAASAPSISRLLQANYERVRTEGYVFTEPGPGLIPLKAYWNEALDAHDEVAIPESEREAQSAGYVFDGAQGFIYAGPHQNARALKRFRDPSGAHTMLTATPEGALDASSQGYVFVRIEGYLPVGP